MDKPCIEILQRVNEHAELAILYYEFMKVHKGVLSKNLDLMENAPIEEFEKIGKDSLVHVGLFRSNLDDVYTQLLEAQKNLKSLFQALEIDREVDLSVNEKDTVG